MTRNRDKRKRMESSTTDTESWRPVEQDLADIGKWSPKGTQCFRLELRLLALKPRVTVMAPDLEGQEVNIVHFV